VEEYIARYKEYGLEVVEAVENPQSLFPIKK
jgi:hypothetical protein